MKLPTTGGGAVSTETPEAANVAPRRARPASRSLPDRVEIVLADHPDVCPFHDLPPAQTVIVREPGLALPFSAEMACGQWHTAQWIRGLLRGAMSGEKP